MSTPEEVARTKVAAAKMLAMQLFALEVDRARLIVVMAAMEWHRHGDDSISVRSNPANILWSACRDLKNLEQRGPLPPKETE